MKNTLKTILSITMLACLLAGIGSAATANGSVPFSLLSVSVDTPGALVPHTQFTIGSVIASGDGSGSFDTCPSATCVTSGSSATLSPDPFFGDTLTGEVLTFGPGSRYTYTVSSQFAPDITNQGQNTTDNIFTLGTFHDTGASFTDSAASLVFAFTESCSSPTTCSESGSATFATPPSTPPSTPEPATLFMTSGALIGAGLFGRRRLAKR